MQSYVYGRLQAFDLYWLDYLVLCNYKSYLYHCNLECIWFVTRARGCEEPEGECDKPDTLQITMIWMACNLVTWHILVLIGCISHITCHGIATRFGSNTMPRGLASDLTHCRCLWSVTWPGYNYNCIFCDIHPPTHMHTCAHLKYHLIGCAYCLNLQQIPVHMH